MIATLKSAAFWRGCAGALLALLFAFLTLHVYQDHQAHHRMVGLWNEYGPLLKQAQQAAAKRPAPPAAPAAQEK